MPKEQCRMCGQRAELQTAPGGAMVCGDCNAIIKVTNLARLHGATEVEIMAKIQETLDQLEGNAPDGQGNPVGNP